VLLCVLLAGSFGLYRWNADFPLGLHPDEKRKARSARDAVPEFFHPHALYHATRLGGALRDARSLQDYAEAGRAASAVFATGLVLASFALFRRRHPPAVAGAAAAVVAAAPIVAVHAHYLKEDACFAFASTTAIAALLAFHRRPTRARCVALGLATGAALAAKYTGVALFAVYALVPLVAPVGSWRAWARSMAAVGAIAAAVFAIGNAAAFAEPAAFAAGVRSEALHAWRGHDVPISAASQRFLFHLRHSTVPGLTPIAAAVAWLGVAATALRRPVAGEDRILLGALAVLYAAIELPPIKPFPDFQRYALPLVPLLVHFAARACTALATRTCAPVAVATALLLALGAAEAHRSWQLVSALDDDTRFAAADRMQGLAGPVVVDDYAVAWRSRDHPPVVAKPLLERDPGELAAARWAITSSFRYDRYLFGESLPGAGEDTRRAARFYRALFACPFEELRPAHGSFAFANPTIRIVDLRACPAPPPTAPASPSP
jgi:hypothetical protein